MYNDATRDALHCKNDQIEEVIITFKTMLAYDIAISSFLKLYIFFLIFLMFLQTDNVPRTARIR